MKINEHLGDDTKKEMNKLANLSNSGKSKKKEKLSKRDLIDLMGMNRDRYERRGGAVRRK